MIWVSLPILLFIEKEKNLKILITGATGNVGGAILNRLDCPADIYAGVRNIEKAKTQLDRENYQLCLIDFEQEIYPQIDFDAVFLIRPPNLAKPDIFRKYLTNLKPTTKIVFLSVQGADTKSYLPHAKIEKIIRTLGLKHTFIRPSYFMENLTTTLWDELAENNRIYLPSSDLVFNWIAVSDVAEVAIEALKCDLAKDSFEITGSSNLNFYQVVSAINNICGTKLKYVSPSLVKFVIYNLKRKKISYILVMILLHYLPRFNNNQKSNHSTDFQDVTGRQPMSIEKFIHDNCKLFQQLEV